MFPRSPKERSGRPAQVSGMGTAFAFKNRTWGLFLKERSKRLLIPMLIGAWTMGFAGSVITENQDLDLTELTFEFLWGIIWRTLFFWVPFVGKLYALGHLWFLWNLFQYSLLLTPVFYLVRNYPTGKTSRFLKSLFTLPKNSGVLIIPVSYTHLTLPTKA